MRGRFITFEGVEGSGKTTQVALLRRAIEARGLSVTATREPGGNPVAEAIRHVLLSAAQPVTSRAELLLFLAARAQLVSEDIRPRLDSGTIVLCDRFTDSTVAYQGYARGHDLALVRRLNEFATGGLAPDLTFLLDLPADAGLQRQAERNRMEAETIDFHRRVRDGYLAEASLDPGRFIVLDASRSPEAIHADILKVVQALLGLHS